MTLTGARVRWTEAEVAVESRRLWRYHTHFKVGDVRRVDWAPTTPCCETMRVELGLGWVATEGEHVALYHVDDGQDDYSPPIAFCPWCGEMIRVDIHG